MYVRSVGRPAGCLFPAGSYVARSRVPSRLLAWPGRRDEAASRSMIEPTDGQREGGGPVRVRVIIPPTVSQSLEDSVQSKEGRK